MKRNELMKKSDFNIEIKNGKWQVPNSENTFKSELKEKILILTFNANSSSSIKIISSNDGNEEKNQKLVIKAKEGAKVLISEELTGSGNYCLKNETELLVAKDAQVKFVSFEKNSYLSEYSSELNIKLSENASVSVVSICEGAKKVSNEIVAELNAKEAQVELYGLIKGYKEQEIINKVSVEHKVPSCTSRALYKGIYRDKSKGTFDGLIKVQPDAQKTEAIQTVKSLLLSQDATSNATPQLIIYADDVKCSHGSTVGRLDEQALFYLQSRGIPEKEAKELLIDAFANEVLDKCDI